MTRAQETLGGALFFLSRSSLRILAWLVPVGTLAAGADRRLLILVAWNPLMSASSALVTLESNSWQDNFGVELTYLISIVCWVTKGEVDEVP
jgi:hypothetical protein